MSYYNNDEGWSLNKVIVLMVSITLCILIAFLPIIIYVCKINEENNLVEIDGKIYEFESYEIKDKGIIIINLKEEKEN